MMQKVIRILKNPRAQQILMWIGPIVLGWIFDRASKQGSKKSVRSRRLK